MALLSNYHTESELLHELEKIGIRNVRTLRGWRARRIGPPWAKFGRIIVYPADKFEEWLRSQVQEPARSRRRAA
jgi:hypothetical protein